MHVTINEDYCVGSGLCEQTCPEVFDVDIVARVIVDPVPAHLEEAVRQAAENCPTEAIALSPSGAGGRGPTGGGGGVS